MKTLNVTFTDREFKNMERKKKSLIKPYSQSWHDLIITAIHNLYIKEKS